jgi:predicted O-methyltransferase YrrM
VTRPIGAAFTLAAHCLALVAAPASFGQSPRPDLDLQVRSFLDRASNDWHDLNVPYADGQVLHDLVVAKGLKRGLEIGTSTGHSAIWIAWAMSKTGGKLITIEIDERRHRIARRNLEAAGVAAYVDARLGDAHALVKELEGPFDFVFSDADKDWYTRYFEELDHKLAVGGCFTAHNVLQRMSGIQEFMDHVNARPDYRTSVDRTSSAGISISCKLR